MKELSNLSKINSSLLVRKKLFAYLNGKTQESNGIPDADAKSSVLELHLE